MDNPYQSPNPEPPAELPKVPEFRRNWNDYSPEYNAAFNKALLIQAGLAVVTVLLLDFGQLRRAFMGCVLLPMGNGLEYTQPTGNAPNDQS